ncbi:MAG: HD domain-containing protein [Clostridiales bacterium]|nr:HD domain-containing protein [Clostridiales bacterium]
MFLPDDVKHLISRLDQQGFEAYAVGGCVRDSLLGLLPNDWDIATSCPPDKLKSVFNDLRLIETGLKHGTLTVLLNGVSYEVTTYRLDGEYTDHRRPDSVEFVSDLKLDLARRDFTVNAMATCDGKDIVDLFGGREDLKNRVIRCVGDPYKRFEEDALRILRALRFASVYDFEIDHKTAQAALELKDTLERVSEERIFAELKKLLCGKGVQRVLSNHSEVIFQILPELRPMQGCAQNNPHHCYDVWAHTVKALASVPQDSVYRLAMLFHDAGKPQAKYTGLEGHDHFKYHQLYSAMIAEACLLRLKADNDTLKRVVRMIKEHDLRIPATQKAVRKQLARLGEAEFMELFPVFKADLLAQNPDMIPSKLEHIRQLEALAEEVIASKTCLTIKDLAVKGGDLRNLGITGAATGEILRLLLDEVVRGLLPNESSALCERAQNLFRGLEKQSKPRN